MKRTVNVTAISAGVMLLISAAVWFAIPYCIEEYTGAVDIGPRAFPRLVSGAMAILSLLQILLLVFKIQKGKYAQLYISDQIPVFAAMVLALAAVVCALFVNLLVAGVICAVIFLILLRVRNWRYYIAVAASGIILYLLMKFVMHIQF